MSYFAPIPPFFGWTAFTPEVPKLYWDVHSQEERIKRLCMEYDKLTKYSSNLANHINVLQREVEELQATVDENMPQLEQRVEALESALENLVSSMLVYDPTKGKYTASIDQARRMVQVLGNPTDELLTVTTVAENETATSLASVMCGELVNQAFARYLGTPIPEQKVG